MAGGRRCDLLDCWDTGLGLDRGTAVITIGNSVSLIVGPSSSLGREALPGCGNPNAREAKPVGIRL